MARGENKLCNLSNCTEFRFISWKEPSPSDCLLKFLYSFEISLQILLIYSCEKVLESEDCLGVVGGHAELDNCDVCDTDSSNDCVQDCAGIWGGDAIFDNCKKSTAQERSAVPGFNRGS